MCACFGKASTVSAFYPKLQFPVTFYPTLPRLPLSSARLLYLNLLRSYKQLTGGIFWSRKIFVKPLPQRQQWKLWHLVDTYTYTMCWIKEISAKFNSCYDWTQIGPGLNCPLHRQFSFLYISSRAHFLTKLLISQITKIFKYYWIQHE